MVDCKEYVIHCEEMKPMDECYMKPGSEKACGESCCDKREECDWSAEKESCYTPKEPKDMCATNSKNGNECGESCCKKKDKGLMCVFKDDKCQTYEMPEDMCAVNPKNGKVCAKGERKDQCLEKKPGKKCNKKCCKKRKKE